FYHFTSYNILTKKKDQNDPNFLPKFLGFSLITNRYLSIMPGYVLLLHPYSNKKVAAIIITIYFARSIVVIAKQVALM
ncbi:hypothetical protein MXE38_11740, partial [Anaerobiospirillum sp. NML120448]|uniref:hypothetical protein n=1 Tax=Anaerobiospirillum sp. NML120448 TaxID=2932816 RepID=UPI001FF33A89